MFQPHSLVFNPRLFGGVIATAAALLVSPVRAEGFGIFEPEAMALGGAAVAIASPGAAAFYNPALLAQHDYDEDYGRHGRLYFPSLTLRGSQTTEDLLSLIHI